MLSLQARQGKLGRKRIQKTEDCEEKLTPGVHHVGAAVLTAAKEEALRSTDTGTGSPRAHQRASHFHRITTTTKISIFISVQSFHVQPFIFKFISRKLSTQLRLG